MSGKGILLLRWYNILKQLGPEQGRICGRAYICALFNILTLTIYKSQSSLSLNELIICIFSFKLFYRSLWWLIFVLHFWNKLRVVVTYLIVFIEYIYFATILAMKDVSIYVHEKDGLQFSLFMLYLSMFYHSICKHCQLK